MNTPTFILALVALILALALAQQAEEYFEQQEAAQVASLHRRN